MRQLPISVRLRLRTGQFVLHAQRQLQRHLQLLFFLSLILRTNLLLYRAPWRGCFSS